MTWLGLCEAWDHKEAQGLHGRKNKLKAREWEVDRAPSGLLLWCSSSTFLGIVAHCLSWLAMAWKLVVIDADGLDKRVARLSRRRTNDYGVCVRHR